MSAQFRGSRQRPFTFISLHPARWQWRRKDILTWAAALEGWRYSLGLTATVVAILSCWSTRDTTESARCRRLSPAGTEVQPVAATLSLQDVSARQATVSKLQSAAGHASPSWVRRCHYPIRTPNPIRYRRFYTRVTRSCFRDKTIKSISSTEKTKMLFLVLVLFLNVFVVTSRHFGVFKNISKKYMYIHNVMTNSVLWVLIR